MSSKTKTVLLGCLGVVVAMLLIGSIAIYLLFVRELPYLTASLEMPSEVVSGEQFEIRISAWNPHDRPVVLDSIDIYDAFMEGVQIVNVDPPARDTMDVFMFRSWFFKTSVDAGTSTTVTFTFRALQPGHYRGDVDVCNPNQDAHTLIADLFVKDK